MDILDIKKEILIDDKKVSELLVKEAVRHYRYYQNNNFYYQLYDTMSE